MSVVITVKISCDTGVFRRSLDERGDEYRRIAERGREKGALHHRFAVGDGFVLINDEWESAEAFHKFFADPELQAFVGSVGGDTTVAPEMVVGESIDSPDKF